MLLLEAATPASIVFAGDATPAPFERVCLLARKTLCSGEEVIVLRLERIFRPSYAHRDSLQRDHHLRQQSVVFKRKTDMNTLAHLIRALSSAINSSFIVSDQGCALLPSLLVNACLPKLSTSTPAPFSPDLPLTASKNFDASV